MAAGTLITRLGRAALAALAVVVGGALFAYSLATYRAQVVVAQAETEQAWGRLEAARELLARVASITPGDARIHASLGAVNASIARFRNSEAAEDRAISAYRTATELHPLDPNLHAALAAAYTQFGRLEEAATTYRHALDLDPNNALLLGSLAGVRELQERHEAAAELYRAALAIRPNESLELRLERVENR